MKTIIYVFIGTLAAIAVTFLFSELVSYIQKANRAIKRNETKRDISYDNYKPYSSYNTYSSDYDVRLRKIETTLMNLEEKIDILIEDFEEIMINKERPSDPFYASSDDWMSN